MLTLATQPQPSTHDLVINLRNWVQFRLGAIPSVPYKGVFLSVYKKMQLLHLSNEC